MRISTQQIWYLVAILKDSLALDVNLYSLSHVQRLKLYNDITNQQDRTVREHEDGEEVPNRDADPGSSDTG